MCDCGKKSWENEIKKCGISNVLDTTENNALFEDSGASGIDDTFSGWDGHFKDIITEH